MFVIHRNDLASISVAFTRLAENNDATLQKDRGNAFFPWHSCASDFSPPSRPRDQLVRLIRGRYERLSRPPSVSSAVPRAQARASPRPTAKRHRNKPARMLAAGADSPVPARPAAGRQPDRRSVAGTLPEPAGGKKLQPG